MAIKYAEDYEDDPGQKGVVTLEGTPNSDWLWGDDRRNFIFGGDGNDNIYGSYGNDVLYGQLGADVLRGADGLDVIDGGAGADVMTGGKDGDYFLFRIADGKSRDTVRDFTLETDQLVLEGGLTVIGASVKHMDFDGVKDTVLTLSNGGSIVLLGVNGSQDWSAAGPNVTTLSEFNDLNLLA